MGNIQIKKVILSCTLKIIAGDRELKMGADSTAVHDIMQKFLQKYVPEQMHEEADADLGSALAECMAIIARHITQCAQEASKCKQDSKKIQSRAVKPKCTATKKDGSECGASALPGQTLCGRHQKET